MEDSHILGVISKATSEPAIKSIEGASIEDGESGKWSPVLEIDDEINSASEDKEVAVVEVPKRKPSMKMIPAAVTEKEVSGVHFKEDALSSIVEAADAANKIAPAAVTAKEVTSAEREPATTADL